MKLKSRPDDFQVEELTSVVPQERGEFAYYRLEKKSLGTPEAIQKLCRVLRVDPRRVRYGGLKDRHAQTIQYLTIDEGPPRHFRDELVQLRYLGQVAEPYGPQSFEQNRFIITLRDIEQSALDGYLQQIAQVQDGLIANYFDDQRFGSVSTDQQFVARALIDGNEELALKLALSSYYEHDRSQERKVGAVAGTEPPDARFAFETHHPATGLSAFGLSLSIWPDTVLPAQHVPVGLSESSVEPHAGYLAGEHATASGTGQYSAEASADSHDRTGGEGTAGRMEDADDPLALVTH